MGIHELAKSVIRQAIVDYLQPRPVDWKRFDTESDAQSFLFADNRQADLSSWCRIAGYDLKELRKSVALRGGETLNALEAHRRSQSYSPRRYS